MRTRYPSDSIKSSTRTGERSKSTYRRHSVEPGRNFFLPRKYAGLRSEQAYSSCQVDKLYILAVSITKPRSSRLAGA